MQTYAYALPQSAPFPWSENDSYQAQLIASYRDDFLYAITGLESSFLADNPAATTYYEANWQQNSYPNAPGDTPLEKYLNGASGISMSDSPKWNDILPAISLSPVFVKFLSTSNSNAFSALQTVVNYRNLDLFKMLAKAVIEGIPGGLTKGDIQELDSILLSTNFPPTSDILL
ncbi:hypothetical protein [Anabaena catenula]|uniref:Uncharacterized protein n=1 Tax=Anabaena catenula FACHB-362 TaxID=2692877 RepID=A0ABR8J7V0_9NOST|nr:hypothetical protein [Anabaena catenula]MBD2694446.1 hypothetical protein [Anabaena catenula FACHB-362]